MLYILYIPLLSTITENQISSWVFCSSKVDIYQQDTDWSHESNLIINKFNKNFYKLDGCVQDVNTGI